MYTLAVLGVCQLEQARILGIGQAPEVWWVRRIQCYVAWRSAVVSSFRYGGAERRARST